MTGRSVHRQGELEADVVDDDLGLTYRLRSQDDGGGGVLVRVDVDPTAGKNVRNMAGTGIAAVTSSCSACRGASAQPSWGGVGSQWACWAG